MYSHLRTISTLCKTGDVDDDALSEISTRDNDVDSDVSAEDLGVADEVTEERDAMLAIAADMQQSDSQQDMFAGMDTGTDVDYMYTAGMICVFRVRNFVYVSGSFAYFEYAPKCIASVIDKLYSSCTNCRRVWVRGRRSDHGRLPAHEHPVQHTPRTRGSVQCKQNADPYRHQQ